MGDGSRRENTPFVWENDGVAPPAGIETKELAMDRLPCFAYGANLDVAGMRARAPRSRVVGRAIARGWRFVIAESGWASIEPARDAEVEGLLWDLHSDDEAALDEFEGIAERLYEKRSLEVIVDGTPREAWAYIERAAGSGTPDPGYLAAIIAAARRLGFSEERIREIEAWGHR